MKARDVIADVVCDWSIRNGFEVGFGKCVNDYADEVIARLEAQGFVVVPRKPTENMVIWAMADMSRSRGVNMSGQFSWVESAIRAAMRAEKEAVLLGSACQTIEHAKPETTPKGEQ